MASTKAGPGEGFCPHCSTCIYVRFVKINGHCASCGQPLQVEDLVKELKATAEAAR